MEREYYTPTSLEKFGNPLTTADYWGTLQSRAVRKFVEACFQRTTTNDIQIFHNGNVPESPRSSGHKNQAEATVAEITYRQCKDLFAANGQIVQGKLWEWENVIQVAPAIISIILGKQNYIKEISQSNLANAVEFAIDVSRHPDLLGETVLNVGFGGSDDQYASSRLPAYLLPGLGIIRQLKDFYADREKEAIEKARSKKAFAEACKTEEQIVGRELTKDELRSIDRKIRDISTNLPNLTASEIKELRSNKAIAVKFPTLRIFFGSQAAIAINHTMQPEGIEKRTKDNIDTLRDYVNKNNPDLLSNVEFAEDIPWTRHSKTARLTLEYLTYMLRQSEDPSIIDTLDTLRKLGKTHGGENGEERATEYAAMHPLVFQDRLNIPFSYFLNGVKINPVVNITIGGRTEEHFFAVRQFLQTNATPEGLKEFIKHKINNACTEEERILLRRHLKALEKWIGIVTKRRELYKDQQHWSFVVRPDLPYQQLALITSIGKQPTYYYGEFDRPYGTSLNQQIEELKRQGQTPNDTLESIMKKRDVVFDLKALSANQKS